MSGTAAADIHADRILILHLGSQYTQLIARASRYLPAIASAKIAEVGIGWRPMPADGLPAIGLASGSSSVYAAVMHSGMTLAALVGRLAAIEILDETPVELLADFRPSRFATA